MKVRFHQLVECAQASKSCQALGFTSWSRSFSTMLEYFNELIPRPTHFLPSLSDNLRLIQSRSTGASFFVTRAEGIDGRVTAMNEIHLSTLQAYRTLMVHGNWGHYDHHALGTLVGERYHEVKQLQLNELMHTVSIFHVQDLKTWLVYAIIYIYI